MNKKKQMRRDVRYQGAIIKDHHILLIKHRENETGRTYWILPGGGIEIGETEEECVKREMKEETNLNVAIIGLLLDHPAPVGDKIYQRLRTYLCEPLNDNAKPGYEPELEASNIYSILEVKWFDLKNEANWDSLLVKDSLTYIPLQQIRRKLGYLP